MLASKKPSILVVDDTPANLTLMTGLLQDSYHVRAAISGEKALKIARSDSPPDLILLDIMMPELDGYEVCRKLKADPKTSELPIIFLTAMSEIEDEEKGLKLGAVDYITKPVRPSIALARIQTHISLYQQKKALIESQLKLATEIKEASEYIANALPAEMNGMLTSRWKHIPSTMLGGDAFGYHWIDSDHLAIYLLDVCGHGVGSALMSVSAINVLRSQSLTSANFKSPASVMTAINSAFLMESHNNKFFTMWYGVYERNSNILTYASAAHPPAFLITKDNAGNSEFHELTTRNLAIGLSEDSVFKESKISLKDTSKLYVYSDGVYEIEKSNGEMFTLAEFTKIIKNLSHVEEMQADIILTTMESLKTVQGPFDDDFSLLEIQIKQ